LIIETKVKPDSRRDTLKQDICELSVRRHDNGYRRTKSSQWITFLPIYWK
jgi:hypothetical protein